MEVNTKAGKTLEARKAVHRNENQPTADGVVILHQRKTGKKPGAV